MISVIIIIIGDITHWKNETLNNIADKIEEFWNKVFKVLKLRY